MERINLLKGKGKRRLEGGDDDEDQQGRLRINNRPALAGVIIEAQKVDCPHCSSLEPTIRRVFREEIQGALAELSRTLLIGRSSSQQIKGPDGRNLQLHFKSRLSLPLFTGGKVEGEQGVAICVELIDANTGHVVTSGPESSIALDVLVLKGDFNTEDDAGWSQEEFDSHVVKEREGKRPLLIGDLQVTLKKGVGTLGHVTFTDNSSWIRSKKFRLGLKVSLGYCEGVRIREAKSEDFTVKDHRGQLYKKHNPPTLIDEVWRLEKIMKDGPFHKRLNNAGICTVEGFLRLVVRDSQELRNILGSGMSNKMWNALIEHARTCVLSEKLYVYYPDDSRIVGVVFNNIYELRGLIDNDQYFPEDSLSDSQKVDVDTWVKKAYANWNQIVEYEGKPLLNFKQTNKSSTLQSDQPLVPVNHPHTSDNQLPPWRLPVSVPFGPSSVDQSMLVGGSGYNDSTTQILNSNTCSHFEPASFTQQANLTNQITGTSYGNGVGFALSPSHSSPLDFVFTINPPRSLPFDYSIQQANVNPIEYQYCHNDQNEISSFISEDVNHQILGNEYMQHPLANDISTDNAFMTVPEVQMIWNTDMHHLLGNEFSNGNASLTVPDEMLTNNDMHQFVPNFGIGGYASENVLEDGFNFHSGRDRSRGDDMAVVGWLKIKAAMRWGIFIRKKAAERRARLVELDDDE